MPLILTSDSPRTPTDAVVEEIRRTAPSPRVAWIPPTTMNGRARFQGAEDLWQLFGVTALEYCDIDEAPDQSQLDALCDYDVVFLKGGEPIEYRERVRRSGLGPRLHECLAAGRLLVAASGGALQLTPNVSLFRLLSLPVEDVVAERPTYGAIGIVDYEILPHVDTFDTAFLDKVRAYSKAVDIDIVGLHDGAALIHQHGSGFQVVGQAVRFRGGVETSVR